MFINKGTATLQTERLILRRFTLDDAHAMYTNWANDPEVTKFLTWQPHVSEDATRELLGNWVKCYSSPEYYNWCITLREAGEPIGNISVVRNDTRNETAHTGYCISRKYWGQGITPEAFKAVIHYLFEECGFYRIETTHAGLNPNSGRVMQKCGLTQEGFQRGAWLLADGTHDDLVLYSILRGEYK